MARAIAALANSVARDFDQHPSLLSPVVSESTVAIQVTPGGPGSGLPAPATPAGVAFDRGGMGLELVLAEHVLGTHGASVAPGADGGVVIRIPRRLRR